MKNHIQEKLIIIGPSTNFEKNVLPIINESEKILYFGPVYDRQKLFELRYGSFAYIHGHSVGGTNPTLVEACYVGRPIIAYDTNFNKEVLGNSGYFFKSSYDLCQIINHLEKENNLKFPRKLSKDYEWESIAKKYLELLVK